MRPPSPTALAGRPRTDRVLALALGLGLAAGLLSLVPTSAGARAAAPVVAPVVAPAAQDPGWFFEPGPAPGSPDAREEADPRSQDYPSLPPRCATRAQQIPHTPLKCVVRKAAKNRPTLVVWGDSHMWMMLPAVREAMRGRKIGLVAFLFGGCVPARPDMEVWAGQPCAETADLANRYLEQMKRRDRKVRVILGSFWGANLDRVYYYPSREIADAAERRRGYVLDYTRLLFRWLGKQKIPTDVLVQGPIAVPPDPDCEPGPTPFGCDIRRSRAYYKEREVQGFLERQVAHLPRGARIIDYSDRVCSATTCRALQPGGVQTWYDPYHLSSTTTKRLASFIKPSIKRLVRR